MLTTPFLDPQERQREMSTAICDKNKSGQPYSVTFGRGFEGN